MARHSGSHVAGKRNHGDKFGDALRQGFWFELSKKLSVHQSVVLKTKGLGHPNNFGQNPPRLGPITALRRDKVSLVRNRNFHDFSAQAVLRRASGNTILFDYRAGMIKKLLAAPLGHEYHIMRSTFGGHVQVPRLVSLSPQELSEELVPGRLVQSLNRDVRVKTVRQVLSGLGSLQAARGESPPGPPQWTLVNPSCLPPELAPHLPAAVRWLGRGPVVPAPADLKPSHLIVRPDGRYVVIDLDDIAMRPAWFPAIYLALGWRSRTLSCEVGGVYDEHIKRLLPPTTENVLEVSPWVLLCAAFIASYVNFGATAQMAADRYAFWKPFFDRVW